jgi:hypothetical protein
VIFPARHLTEPVSVRTYQGEGAYGPLFGPAVTTWCQLDAGRRLVRNRAGDEVVSESTLRLSPDLDESLDLEALFTPESLVAAGGRGSRVITAKPVLARGRLVYLEVTLT